MNTIPYLEMSWTFLDAFSQTLYKNDDFHEDAIDHNLDLCCVDGGGKEGLYNDVVSLVESIDPLYSVQPTMVMSS